MSASLTIDADEQEISKAVAFAEEYIASLHLSHDLFCSFAAAIDEVLANTIAYAFKDKNKHQIKISLKAENKTVTVLSDSVPVRIFGTSEDVAAVTGENITVVIDLSDYTGAAGTYTVPAYVDIMANGDIGVSGTYELQIKISEELPSEDVGNESPETNNTGDA